MHKLSAVLILQLLALHIAFAKPLTPDDFAFNAALSEPVSNTKASLRQLVLPVSVYENMQRRDHGDLRVFSAEGQVAPHQFKQGPNLSGTQEIALIFYPFSKQEAANPANIRVIIDQKAGQQRLDISQKNEQTKPPVLNEYQYIIENRFENKISHSKYIRRLCKIKLHWEQSKPSMILPFTLQSSDNLQNWTSLGRSLNVSDLSYSGAQLLRNEVDFSCTSQKYLRLTWKESENQIHLRKVSGIYVQGSEKNIQWKTLAKPSYDKDGNWLFESDVVSALSRMEFVAPQSGLLYKGTLYSRNDKKSPWKFHKNIVQYRLNMGEDGSFTEQQSSPFSLRPNSDRYWKLQPENEGRLNDNQLPEIRVGWQQLHLLFIAQGSAPFQLCYGNPVVKPVNDLALMRVIQGIEKGDMAQETVTLGKPYRTTNFQQANSIPWKKLGLWVLLLLGTALLAYMALSLYRQMDGKD